MDLQERGKSQPPDIGVAGALTFARHAFFEIGEFLFDVGFHAVERCHAPLEIVDAKSAQPQQRVLSFHDALPFPTPPSIVPNA